MTPQEFAAKEGISVQRVHQLLNMGRIAGAKRIQTPRGPYWKIPKGAVYVRKKRHPDPPKPPDPA